MGNSFDERRWAELAAQIADTFRMRAPEAAALKANQTARLIAAIPFAAGCAEPERTALSHLATYLLAGSPSCRRVFDHKAADDRDALARLAPIADFQGGDKEVIDRGMRLLAIIMVSGYRHDLEKDSKSGEYNPLLAKTWEADQTVAALSKGIDEKAALPYGFLTKEESVRAFWGTGSEAN
jgi:hypothetical protein